VALLTTGSGHPEQVARQQADDDGSQATYGRSFWDDDQVFYGHVLGFKGMEQRAFVRPAESVHERPWALVARSQLA
jgi:hypothetical protein